ncbi:MAG: tRNA (adenosine(37)-N6)-threonylcarbamoyltransferase complex transferase subunit TsaD [Oscillospiraceae bacterium]|jgi:N6-L-threonylcarbamoyladenine synthase|nr:tRNA (adenosine(37)-N6)-threonylcarbamoyltransferase complex transferase subunit TsaD [Oscillospiraceae bacterium]
MYIDASRAQAAALRKLGRAVILAIESSCDETAAAVIRDGREILSNVVSTQIPLHARYGGVVPEIASRAHVEAVNAVVDVALEGAGMTFGDIDAIAVTHGPGLVGALLVGVSTAKALAFALDKPLIPTHHIDAHISANYLAHAQLEPPFVCLVVSGGHTHIVQTAEYGVYRLLGQTLDDAAGEAFDKAARVLGLPYPGGPALDELAELGDPTALRLPRPKTENPYDFSFSGLKTAFIQLMRGSAPPPRTKRDEVPHPVMRGSAPPPRTKRDEVPHTVMRDSAPPPRTKRDEVPHTVKRKGLLDGIRPEDAAASFREAVCETLVDKLIRAAHFVRASNGGMAVPIALAGGVAANRRLRALLAREASREGMTIYMPPLSLCTDNAAMVGAAAFYRMMRGDIADMSLNAEPTLPLPIG